MSGWGFHDFIIYDGFTHVQPPPAGPRDSECQMNKPAPPPVFHHEPKGPRATTSPEPFTGAVIRFHNGVVVTLKEIVYQQYALIGRSICGIRGEVKDRSDLSGKDLLVKISWPLQWRQSEVDYLEVARSYALNQHDEHILGHIPQVLLHQDFYSTVDGPRGNALLEMMIIGYCASSLWIVISL
ncbi:hypothetical protein BS47DRAFT_428324 [Hydnum rufescens UP504]|uniref:Uncharacterized protein n=1 Tax=Hydnum rufescens UP504 TaxID=1448309 RepID=A0A9P6DM31_9AGAM|nr:hypothetical protein BS47DRAFT_428324 [Hydnum rufescens UP504]